MAFNRAIVSETPTPTHVQARNGDVNDSGLGELQVELGAGLDGLAELDGCADVEGAAGDDVDLQRNVGLDFESQQVFVCLSLSQIQMAFYYRY